MSLATCDLRTIEVLGPPACSQPDQIWIFSGAWKVYNEESTLWERQLVFFVSGLAMPKLASATGSDADWPGISRCAVSINSKAFVQ